MTAIESRLASPSCLEVTAEQNVPMNPYPSRVFSLPTKLAVRAMDRIDADRSARRGADAWSRGAELLASIHAEIAPAAAVESDEAPVAPVVTVTGKRTRAARCHVVTVDDLLTDGAEFDKEIGERFDADAFLKARKAFLRLGEFGEVAKGCSKGFKCVEFTMPA